jgi:NAD(P)-dependent dehydrogenase (short-subunit alcohol dehydrogenase family)
VFDVTPEHWDQIMSINARAVFFCLQAAAKIMREQGGGAIVNISSIGGKGWSGAASVAYAASKAAVIAMTRLAAVQLAEHGIRVNAVCPGITDTPLYRRTIARLACEQGISVDALHEATGQRIPLGRLTESEEIASVCTLLASAESGPMTGQSLNVDGGLVFD